MEQSEHSGTVGSASRNTNKKARSYCFTYNNYEEKDIGTMEQYLSDTEYIFGEEIGKNGTPHLQGVIRFKNPVSFERLKKDWPKIHWEICKNWTASKKYCSKEGKIHTNMNKKKTLEEQYNDFMEEEYKNVKWKPWQQKVIDILNEKPDRRKVHWFWEPNGNSGKTFLTRYIEWKYPTVIVNGKQNDVFNGIKTFLENKEKYPNPVIIDIPRTNENYVCYSTMEKIKDGLFYSGKYEGGIIRLLPCHLLVFANFEPNINMMSEDRWNIVRI